VPDAGLADGRTQTARMSRSTNPHPIVGRRPPRRGHRPFNDAQGKPRVELHDPSLQFLKRLVEAPLLGPVALGDGIGEGER
jgi:hypothetical protein